MPYGHISPKSESDGQEDEDEDEKEGEDTENDEQETDKEEEQELKVEEEKGVEETALSTGATSHWPDFPSKTGFVAWFVSNCRTVSHREERVEELRSYLPPDSIHVGLTMSAEHWALKKPRALLF
jgi:predicted acyl esterase